MKTIKEIGNCTEFTVFDNEIICIWYKSGDFLYYNLKKDTIQEFDLKGGYLNHKATKEDLKEIGKLWHEFISRKEN